MSAVKDYCLYFTSAQLLRLSSFLFFFIISMHFPWHPRAVWTQRNLVLRIIITWIMNPWMSVCCVKLPPGSQFIRENRKFISSPSPSLCIEMLLVSHYGNIYNWVSRNAAQRLQQHQCISSIVLALIFSYIVYLLFCFTFCIFQLLFFIWIVLFSGTFIPESFFYQSSLVFTVLLFKFSVVSLGIHSKNLCWRNERIQSDPQTHVYISELIFFSARFLSFSDSHISNGQLTPIGKIGAYSIACDRNNLLMSLRLRASFAIYLKAFYEFLTSIVGH